MSCFSLYDTVEITKFVGNEKSRGFLLWIHINNINNVYDMVQFIHIDNIRNGKSSLAKDVMLKTCRMVLVEKSVIQNFLLINSPFNRFRDRIGI